MSGHLWESTRDPEGFFSTLPAIATVLLGVFTGEWLLKNSPQKRLSGCWYLASPAWLWADLGNVVSHHQEIVDQFLCALQRRICLGLLARLPMGHRCQAMAPRLDQSVSHFGMNAITAYTISWLFAELLYFSLRCQSRTPAPFTGV